MSNDIRNIADHLPKGKKRSPLGKWLLSKLLHLNNLPVHNERDKRLLLTTVSRNEDYSQIVSKEQKDERSVASKVDSSNTAWSIKIFLN